MISDACFEFDDALRKSIRASPGTSLSPLSESALKNIIMPIETAIIVSQTETHHISPGKSGSRDF
jgi:hypothetical protein